MERAEYNRHSRARMAETAKRRVETSSAGRAGAHRPSEALHPTRSSDVLPRIARERVPTVPHVAETRGNVTFQSSRETRGALLPATSHQPLATSPLAADTSLAPPPLAIPGTVRRGAIRSYLAQIGRTAAATLQSDPGLTRCQSPALPKKPLRALKRPVKSCGKP